MTNRNDNGPDRGGPPGGEGEFKTAKPKELGQGYDPYSGGDPFRSSSGEPFDTGPDSDDEQPADGEGGAS